MALRPRSLTQFTQQEARTLRTRVQLVRKQRGLVIKMAQSLKEYGRLLIIIPKKSGTAPQRNKIRRQLKAIFYEQQLFKNNKDVVIIVSKEAIGIHFTELQDIVCKALSN